MKSVLISIQPKWVEKILSSEKTVEVRKSKPKLEAPFKCYIYCTKSGGYYKHIYVNEKDARNKYGVADHWSKKQQIVEVNGSKSDPNNFLAYECYLAEGKVVAEFICDDIKAIFPYDYICDNKLSITSCLMNEEIIDYLGLKRGYGWHISDLVVYDKPKELSELLRPCTDKYQYCQGCKHGLIQYPAWVETREDLDGCCFDTICLNTLKRPPQSWCYVEGMEDTE